MNKFLLFITLFISIPSAATEQCKGALLKSILFEVNISETIDELSKCKMYQLKTCKTIETNLNKLRKNARKAHLEANKTCSINS